MTIKLNETGLTAIVVPEDATDISIGSLGQELYFIHEGVIKYITIGQGKYELLGEVTSNWISFSTENYVEKEYIEVSDIHSLNGYIEGIAFKDYNDEDNCFESSIESFYSLLQSKGIYFVNPMEKPKGTNLNSSFFEMQIDFNAEKEWQSHESKIVKKVVILKEIKWYQ